MVPADHGSAGSQGTAGAICNSGLDAPFLVPLGTRCHRSPKMASLFKIASFACLGGFLFGYDLGLIAGALLYMDTDTDLHLSTKTSEVIVGTAKLGAVFGTFIGGALMVEFGRRKAISWSGLFFLLGPICMAGSNDASGLSFGRFIVGLGVGASAVCVPAYVAEMAHPENRGALVTTYELMLCVGMGSSGFVDFLLRGVAENWRWMVAAPAVPALVMLLSVFVLPESPRWLVVKGNLPKALKILHSLREGGAVVVADTSTARVEAELMELWSAVEKERDEKVGDVGGVGAVDERRIASGLSPQTPQSSVTILASTYSFLQTLKETVLDSTQLFSAKHPEHVPFKVAVVLAFFNQAVCSTSVVNYAPIVLRSVGMTDSDSAVLFASLISVAKFCGVLVSMFWVDKIGRRPLLIYGSAGCCVFMFLLAISIASKSAALALLSMCLFMLSFSASWAGVFWVLLSEMFSMRWKSSAMSAATAILFLTGSMVDFIYLSAYEGLGAISFIFIALICAVAGVYSYLAVPETKGKTLAELQREFEGSRRLGDEGEFAAGRSSSIFHSISQKFSRSGSSNRYVAMTELQGGGVRGVDDRDDRNTA